MRLKSEKASVDGPGMARWGHAITSIAAALVLLGCGDPSLKEQALEAAVGRFEAIGVPEGYEQESLKTRDVITNAFSPESGWVRATWTPMDGVMGSMAIIDQHLVGQGYRRYSNKVCLDNGNYSLVYVRSDIQISISADSEGQASVTHYFHESLTAPQLGTIPEQELLEIPAQCAAAN